MRDPYEILGTEPDVSQDELRRAFRSLARRMHPDVNGEPEAQVRFAAIAEAYNVLSDPTQRAAVDRRRELLREFEASRPPARDRARRGQDTVVRCRLEPSVAAAGGRQEVRAERYVTCSACSGHGVTAASELAVCPGCQGAGHLPHVQHTHDGEIYTWRPCAGCAGFGLVARDSCPDCAGEGRLLRDDTLSVVVPPHHPDDACWLLVAGHGHAGPAGGEAGDLYLHLQPDHDPRSTMKRNRTRR